MVNAYIRAKSPKGNVGVTGVVDAGELSAYSAGVISGYTASGASSWTLSIGGVTGTQDVAVAKNPGGESELLVGTAGQDIDFVIGGAPGTPGQSRTDALVIYKDPFTTSVVNNGIDVVDYQVVAGTPAATGSQVPPNDATIRATIPTGSLKFVVVVGYVTIANGTGSVTTGNFTRNVSAISTSLLPSRAGIRKRLGSNKGSDTATGGVTTSYATYATVTATSQGGLCEIDVSMIFNNANSGSDRGASYKVQCDGVDVGTPLSGVILVPLSPTNLPVHFSESFTHTPSAGSHTWTLKCLASANAAVTLRRPTIQVDEILT